MANVSAVVVFDCLKDYYKGYIEEGIIKIIKDDKDIFEWEEVNSKVKIAIKRKNLIIPSRILNGTQFLWVARFFQDYNYELDNKIMFFKAKGFQVDTYAEFLFSYSKIEDECSDVEMSNFNIDDVKFEIGEPSELFKVMFQHFKQDIHFKQKQIHTIKLRNINKEKLESYLQNAMYLIHKHAPSEYVGDYPQIYKYLYAHNYYQDIELTDEKMEKEIDKSFKVGKYPEALAFFNEGKQKRDFLSFYKVIEHFFVINRKNEFDEYIKKYNDDKNLDLILNKITKVYKDNEIDLLGTLINNLENMEPILKLASSKGLISNQADKKEFTKNLYEFRNSKVHGKGDANFELLVPTILNLNENNDWEIIIEELAELIIEQFCFPQPE
ncbi:hypothetical protein [Bacillus wiedmannii]|uniref:hypothetical protein n=1 Tax=Bacillus wiedmannii TaxID=1890302 RepID=UPI0039FC882F